ncbi:hypothetical protein VCR15J5_570003 [Vibrio crassostreae]|nr:hypothetical protein VCR15J5_570003 [Vibrio crassostreae]
MVGTCDHRSDLHASQLAVSDILDGGRQTTATLVNNTSTHQELQLWHGGVAVSVNDSNALIDSLYLLMVST